MALHNSHFSPCISQHNINSTVVAFIVAQLRRVQSVCSLQAEAEPACRFILCTLDSSSQFCAEESIVEKYKSCLILGIGFCNSEFHNNIQYLFIPVNYCVTDLGLTSRVNSSLVKFRSSQFIFVQ